MVHRISIYLLLLFPIIIVFFGMNEIQNRTVLGPSLGFQEISPLSAVLPSEVYADLGSLAQQKRLDIIRSQENLEKANFFLALIASVTVIATAILSFLAETNKLKSTAPQFTRHFLPIITATILTAQPIITNKIITKDRDLSRISTTISFYVEQIVSETSASIMVDKAELLRVFLNEL